MSCKFIREGVKLFDNQVKNVKGLIRRRRALLTDHVGSGKTLSILYSFALLKERGKLRNMLVLTPKSAYAKEVWKKDIAKFTNLRAIDLEVFAHRLEGRFDKLELLLEQYDVIYGKHSHSKQLLPIMKLLCQHQDLMLTVDECHAFKNPASQLTVKFREALLQATNVWFITGTSLSKSLEDVYNIINLLYPWYLGAFTHFRDTYCLVKEKVVGRKGGRLVKALDIVGVKNEEEFKKKLEPLVITGESFTELNYHYVDYDLSNDEEHLYRKIANGIDLSETMSSEEWIQHLLSQSDDSIQEHRIKEVERFSSRFIYLQTAADGVLTARGTQDYLYGTKMNKLIDLVKSITEKGRSVIVYFDFLASLEVAKARLRSESNAVILQSTGDCVLADSDVTEAKCKQKPHVILCTKAASESASYYFIADVIFFHIPTVPHVFVQLNGRITRKNTLFPGDLHCWIFRSNNVDLYKLLVVSAKSYQMEIVQGEELNIPPDYKAIMQKADRLEKMKKILLWFK